MKWLRATIYFLAVLAAVLSGWLEYDRENTAQHRAVSACIVCKSVCGLWPNAYSSHSTVSQFEAEMEHVIRSIEHDVRDGLHIAENVVRGASDGGKGRSGHTSFACCQPP